VALDREVARLRASGTAVSRVNVDQAQANRDLAEADLQVARAELAQTQDLLSRSRLTAPFDGVVADRVRRKGEEVARGEVIARLVNPDELEIRLFVRCAMCARSGRAMWSRWSATVASSRRPSRPSFRPGIRARSLSKYW
jgi:multidrug resistance efflux pump